MFYLIFIEIHLNFVTKYPTYLFHYSIQQKSSDCYLSVNYEQGKNNVDSDSDAACEIPLLPKPEVEIDFAPNSPEKEERKGRKGGKCRVGFAEVNFVRESDSPEREVHENSVPKCGKCVGFVAMECNDMNSNKREINEDLSRLSRKGAGSLRYKEPRLSLLGKPLVYKFHRRDLRYRRIQARIYNFLERPKCWNAFMYHILM